MEAMEMNQIAAMMIGMILYIVLIFSYYAAIILKQAVSVASYVLQGLGFSAMAKKRGIERPWLAWVPVAGCWLMGSISDQYREKVTGEDPELRKKLLIQRIAMTAVELMIAGCAVIWYFGMIFALIIGEAFYVDTEAMLMPMLYIFVIILLVMLVVYLIVAVLYFISQYKALLDIYRSSDPKTATVYFVLSFFFQMAITLGIFLNRNKTLGMPGEPEEISAE